MLLHQQCQGYSDLIPMCLWIQFLITLYLSFFVNQRNRVKTNKNSTENKVYNEILHSIKSISLLLDPPYFYLYTELYPCEPKRFFKISPLL